MAETGEEDTCGLCFSSNTIGVFNLAENLSFTKYKGINCACYLKNMACGTAVKTVEKVLRANLLACILEGYQILLEKLSRYLIHCRNNIQFSAVTG